MEEAQNIVQLVIPFMTYISPLLILMCIVAVADHITDFFYETIKKNRQRLRV